MLANLSFGSGGRCRGRELLRAQGKYLGFDVVERRRADDGEADQENVGLWIGQRAKSVVIFLSSGIPEP